MEKRGREEEEEGEGEGVVGRRTLLPGIIITTIPVV